jgi:hypothetical protein
MHLPPHCTTACALQGVALVVLSFFRDEAAARELADVVAAHGGLLGAAVCCAEEGGSPDDEWTTCDRDRRVPYLDPGTLALPTHPVATQDPGL